MDDSTAVGNLLAEYSLAVGERRWDDWTALFEPDGRLTVRDQLVVGHDELRRFIERTHDGWATSRPFVANVRVEFDASASRVVSSFYLVRGHGGALAIVSCGTYRDVLVRTPLGWRFRHRHIEIDQPTVERGGALDATE